MLSVNIVGTQAIQAKMLNKITKPKIESALDKAALMIQADAVRMSPVDTGRLRASIDVKRCGALCRSIGTSISYAPYQEYGTQKMSPQPFLRPALQKNKASTTRLIAEACK